MLPGRVSMRRTEDLAELPVVLLQQDQHIEEPAILLEPRLTRNAVHPEAAAG